MQSEVENVYDSLCLELHDHVGLNSLLVSR